MPKLMSQTQPEPCPECGFRHQCICHHVPRIDSNIELALLTHSNEFTRDTNTGKLLTQTLNHCNVYEWQRKSPPQDLLDKIANPKIQAFVVYPTEDSITTSEAFTSSLSGQTPLFIILDGTWQEAKKMINKSDWLSKLPSVHLKVEQTSNYQLRRNQDEGHLCTCEVGSQLLVESGHTDHAQQLDQYFDLYMRVFKADKCGHALS
ncbi:DTW domain-containing protein [Vibrio makurazakiensis]|uniref:tRNA-uridine aminocarboxypropyltransferase n=1 Tax=Vibrio makurazakiensis TaxID=2910250 RepID=UPI003D0EA722